MKTYFMIARASLHRRPNQSRVRTFTSFGRMRQRQRTLYSRAFSTAAYETFRIPHLLPKRTIRILDEGGGGTGRDIRLRYCS